MHNDNGYYGIIFCVPYHTKPHFDISHLVACRGGSMGESPPTDRDKGKRWGAGRVNKMRKITEEFTSPLTDTDIGFAALDSIRDVLLL